jgi:CBS domain containing-hemolysin-like protein
VFDGGIDNVIGLVYARDLLLNPHVELARIIRPVRFVPEIVTLTQLITFFRETQTQLAIAVDEAGGVTGLVTIEDVAEQIVGELSVPEQDRTRAMWERLDERRYRVSGQLAIREWADQFGARSLDDRVTTLAGLVLARLGRAPVVGDRIAMGNLVLTVESLHRRRIEWLLLELFNGRTVPPEDSR